MAPHDQNIDFAWVVQAFRRRWRVVAICLATGLGAALGYSLLQTNQYSAEASLLFRDPAFDEQLFSATTVTAADADREAATNLALVSLDTVADLTADELGAGYSGADISNQVAVESGGQSDIVTVRAENQSPGEAALIANTFADSYVEFRREADRTRVRTARELVERNFEQLAPRERTGQAGSTLQQQISKLEAFEALQTGNAEVVQRAEVPSSPSSPRPFRNAILGATLGLLIGLAMAVLLERLDRRLRDPKEFEAAFGLPLLATIPERKSLSKAGARMEHLLGSDSETLRTLRARLRYFNIEREIGSVLVTSAASGDGKTTVSWNFAVSASRAGTRTLLVEADLRRPTMAARENLAPIPGLAELLSGQAELDRAIQPVAITRPTGQSPNSDEISTSPVPDSEDQPDGPRLDVIVAGSPPPNAGELLESERMKRLVDELKSNYDLLVIDTPPLSVVSDAIPLLTVVDGTIIVARTGGTTRDAAKELRDELDSLEASVLGVIVNRASTRRHGYYSNYYSQPRP